MRADRHPPHEMARASDHGNGRGPLSMSNGLRAEPSPAPAPAASPLAGLDRVLIALGFSAREARLYLVILRHGPVEVREAAGSAGLHRATAYRALLRLLTRGVIVGDGRTPQRFQAVGIDVIIARVGNFLREEEELNALVAQAAKAAVLAPDHGPRLDPIQSALGPQLLTRPSSGPHPALAKIASAHRSLDVMFRPLATAPSYRGALVQALTKLVRTGVSVRLVLDAAVADRRIVDRLGQEGVVGSPRLQVRQFTPLGIHSYLIDGIRSIRFPILGVLARPGDVAVVSEDPERVSNEVGRFEAVWARATGTVGRHPSTRSFGWRSPEEAARVRPPTDFTFTSTLSTKGVMPDFGRAGSRSYIRPG